MKAILITGASNGIGKAIAEAYLDAEFQVYNIDIKAPSRENKSSNYHFYQCDLSDTDKLSHILDKIPHIDYLVLNAVYSKYEEFKQMNINNIKMALDVNLTANVQLSKWYVTQFSGTSGRIVLLSSTRAKMSEANTIGYSISKGGIEALTHSLAITLQDDDITVNAIAPGWIHTTSESLRKEDHSFHPSGRVGKPSDIVQAVQFILNPENDFLNGEVITIDGGVTKKMIYPE